MGDIRTYVQESFLNFVTGTRSLDEFDQYTDRLEQMGIDIVLENRQQVYDGFLKNR